MTLDELLRRVRSEANDNVVPYFWSDEQIVGWLNDAISEACIRGRLIHESASAQVCEYAVAAGQSVIELHPAIYELTHIKFFPEDDSRPSQLLLTSTVQLDAFVIDWREATGRPANAIQGDTGLRLAPIPDQAGILRIEGFRTPLNPLAINAMTAEPEIHREHHRHLVNWVLHKGFSVPDMEAFDANRSAAAGAEFTRYFGERPDVDLRRSTREDTPQHVEGFWV